jgi:hypothetical protein
MIIASRYCQAAVMAITVSLLVVPVRLWTILAAPGDAQYAHYPLSVQAAVAAIFTIQLVALWRHHDRLAQAATVGAVIAAASSMALLAYGDALSAGWILWAVIMGLECWVYWEFATRRIGAGG